MRIEPPKAQLQTGDWGTASRCYYCEEPMTVISKSRVPLRLTATSHTLECRNDRCKYFVQLRGGDRWRRVVEVNADGTIPVRMAYQKELTMPNLTPEQQQELDEAQQWLYTRTIKKDEIHRGE